MSGEWTVLHRYIAPVDPDYPSLPAKVTLWRDNLGGLVLGMDIGDGAKVILQPLPGEEAEDFAFAMLGAAPAPDTTSRSR